MAHTATLITQLRAMLQLTQTEVQIVRVRVAQARTEAVRRELRQNGDNAEKRTEEIAEHLRGLGGVPDVVTPTLGRLTALFKSALEQSQPLDEALLSDLSLEHQLLDRARYIKVLAEAAETPKVGKLAERLETAHTATVDWLTTVLAEEALSGPVALRETPLQRVAGGVTRVANYPGRFAIEQLNRTVDSFQRSGEQAATRVNDVADKLARVGGAAREALSAGRDASLAQAEQAARRERASDTAEALHETRRDMGALSADELPVRNYSGMSTQDAIAAIKKLTRTEDINAMIGYEEAHRNRHSVVSAAQTRHAAVAKDAAGVSP